MIDHHLKLEFPTESPSSDHFRVAYDLYRSIAFYNAALADTSNHDAMIEDTIENAYQALLNVAYLLRPAPQERFLEYLKETFASLNERQHDAQYVFSTLRRLCGRVIGMLGIPKDELKAELDAYPKLRDQERKNSLKIIFEFLYTKKILQASKFDSSQKARIHKLVDAYGEEKMKKKKFYQEYLEFRDTNKLRITSPTVALGALEQLLVLSDLPSDIADPLMQKVDAYKNRIEKEISTSPFNESIDFDSFDVESYLKQRFTKEHERGHARPDMSPMLIEEIDALAIHILQMTFPELIALDGEKQKQRILTYIEADDALPKSSLIVPHIYAEEIEQ